VCRRDLPADPKAFGDNIGGALYFGATLLLLAVEFRRGPH